MDDTTLKVAVAAFIHDIGKLAEDGLEVPREYLNNHADLYQPFKYGRHTHRHAVFTAAFIEQFEKILPQKLNRANWGLEDAFINLAAGHHRPTTPLQWIIAMADRLSSGWDRGEFDEKYNYEVAPQHYRRTRLTPIFERLMHDVPDKSNAEGEYRFCYPLREISPANIFPGMRNEISPTDDGEAGKEYRLLFEGMVYDLERLLHKEDSIQLWLEHLESLVMIYASLVPAARAGRVVPDVSLYDHLKLTAAFAVAVYLYHRDLNSMSVEAIQDYQSKKFLIIQGNFFGIQSFIGAESGASEKNRAKILRGRSFAVSLFSELAADMLCREIGIPSISVVLNAAGKFTLIAPNTDRTIDAVYRVEDHINAWLLKIAFGESAMGFTTIGASPSDFVHGRFIHFWKEQVEMNERKKLRKFDLDRYGGTVEGYLEGFRNDLNHPLCPLCGKRPSDPEVEGSALVGENRSACRICRDHIFLGENLVKKERIAILKADSVIRGDKLLAPIFDSYQVAFPDGGLKDLAREGSLLKYWDISVHEEGKVAKDITSRFLNGHVPTYGKDDLHDLRLLAGRRGDEKKEELIDQLQVGAPKTMSHIANKALILDEEDGKPHGIEALGVLKADVDRLGMLFSQGLDPERFTLARLATLSRQIDWFFSLYLPHLLKRDNRFSDIYTVFAGGDDLFMVGPWNRIIDLVAFLQQSFADYVCGNPEIHFSAGIALKKPNISLTKLADSAEEALSRSKDAGRNRITLFGETAEWREFMKLLEIGRRLEEWLDKDWINTAMAYRLNQFIDMAGREKAILESGEVTLGDMECLKWYALFHYSVERNVGKGKEKEERERIIQDFSKCVDWLKEYGGKMKIALWKTLYSRRKGE